MNYPKPLKKFGQNYLIDKNIINKIVEEFNPEKGQKLLEIGPGRGAITGKIIEAAGSLTAVEIDTRVGEELLSSYPSLTLINNDFLDLNLTDISTEKDLRVIGNIPYNITSPILFKLIKERMVVKDAVLMMQYEVAKRLTAEKGTKDYGILAVILNYFAETQFCFKISPNVFEPKPKVHSALVHLYFNKETDVPEFDNLFIKIVKASFGNRRKTLKNSLTNSIFKAVNFSNSGVDLSLRAEQLNLEEFLMLTRFVYNLNK